MSFSHPNYQQPPQGYPPQQPGYPPQHMQPPPPQQHYYGAPPAHYPPPVGPQPAYPPHLLAPAQPYVSVDVHQQYAQPVQQGSGFNQPLFSPSQIAMDSSSPSHQLDGSAQARMAGAAALTGLRDRWWLLLFGVHLVMLFIVEGMFGSKMTSHWGSGSSSLSKSGQTVVGMLVVSAVVGSVFSALWFKCIQWMRGRVVLVSVATNVALSLACAILYFSTNQAGAAVPFIIAVVWILIWITWNRHRIPLAEATLAAASKSLSDNWGPIIVGYCTALLQVGWLLNASFTVIAVYYVRYLEPQTCLAPSSSHDCPRGDGGTAWSGFAFWYAVFSFYWTSQVIRNLAHFTTAGTVSSWWLVSEIQTPTWGAFKRASTTSLGTIAVGSLLVAVIEMLNGFARYGGCICGCLCGLVRRAMRWFNRYAFIVSAMYGSEYFPAAKHISSLMGAKFWELIVNDSLTSAVFWMGSFLGGVVAAIVGGLWAWSAFDDDGGVSFLVIVLCFLIGFNVALTFMAVLDSAVATTLVVWAEDPQSMHRNRPEHHDMIAAAAQHAYPTEFALVFVPVRPVHVQAPAPAYQPPPQHFNPSAPPAY